MRWEVECAPRWRRGRRLEEVYGPLELLKRSGCTGGPRAPPHVWQEFPAVGLIPSLVINFLVIVTLN